MKRFQEFAKRFVSAKQESAHNFFSIKFSHERKQPYHSIAEQVVRKSDHLTSESALRETYIILEINEK